MKIGFDITKHINFGSKREDRNKVNQLQADNKYSLTENNQKNITNSIKNLSRDSSEDNIRFLMRVASNLQYDTNINLDKKPNNEWKLQLREAIEHALQNADEKTKKILEDDYKRIFLEKKDLTQDEKELLDLRENILNSKTVKTVASKPQDEKIRNIQRNLDYFVISTEAPIGEKKDVLKQLSFFLSPKYRINPQLKNDKAKVLSEILNDIIIKTPEDDKLTIKDSWQRLHGSCGDFTVRAKALPYEHKSEYVNQILSELDNTDKTFVYDISKLGTGAKIPVKKAPVDFDNAKELDYRIIDASALQKMHIAGSTVGNDCEIFSNYVTFDKKNFGIFDDGFFLVPLKNEKLESEHKLLQALIRAKETANKVKSERAEKVEFANNQRLNQNAYAREIHQANSTIENSLKILLKGNSTVSPKNFLREINNLEKPAEIDKSKGELAQFEFIPNEENIIKQKKMTEFVKYKLPDVDSEKLSKEIDKIFKLYEFSKKAEGKLFEDNNINHVIANKDGELYYKELFKTAAAYRVKTLAELDIPERVNEYLVEFNIPDEETNFVQNLDNLIKKVKSPHETEVTNLLVGEKFGKSKEEIIKSLKTIKDKIKNDVSTEFDSIYSDLLVGDRKSALYLNISDTVKKIKSGDKNKLISIAKKFNMPADESKIVKKLEKIQNEFTHNISDERYIQILNEVGFKSQSVLLTDTFKELRNQLTDDKVLKKFAQKHNFNPEDKAELNKVLSGIISRINGFISYMNENQNLLSLTDKNGKALTTIKDKDAVLKVLENKGEILTDAQLKSLQKKFTQIEYAISQEKKALGQGKKIKDKSAYIFSAEEKNLIKKIEKDFNKMYHNIIKEYDAQSRILAKPIAKIAQEEGQKMGLYWVQEEGCTGMMTSQSVRLFEQMTGQKYYIEPNIVKAANNIKNGIHSGGSGTSVHHKQQSGHAQYISYIEPIEVTNAETGEKILKDAIMHDNSWWAREKANTWVDSQGVTRGDYKQERGGEKGFIVDKNWRNGTFVEEFLDIPGQIENQNVESKIYKKIKHPSFENKFSMFYDTQIQGVDPSSRTIINGLVDLILNQSSSLKRDYHEILKDASKLSKEELDTSIDKIEGLEKEAVVVEKELLKLIRGNETIGESIDGVGNFNQGIVRFEDYQKLDKNHPLKLLLGKLALKESYDTSLIEEKINKAVTAQQLEELQQEIVNIAKDNMKYVFGKNKDYLKYVKNSTNEPLFKILNDFSEKYGFSLVVENKKSKTKGKKVEPKNLDFKISKIIENLTNSLVENKINRQKPSENILDLIFSDLSKKKFDGKLSTIVDRINGSVLNIISERLSDKSKLPQVKEELKSALTPVLKEKLEFQLNDLKNSIPNFIKLREWIDRAYNPESDEAFVKIFRNIQEMNAPEFEKLLQKMTPKDLGVEHTDEFDLLKAMRTHSFDIEDKFLNQILLDTASKRLKLSTPKKIYNYFKFNKNYLDDVYPKGMTFDEKYMDFYSAFFTSKLNKIVKSWQDEAFRKYGVRPSFPNNEAVSREMVQEKVNQVLGVLKTLIIDIKDLKTSKDFSESIYLQNQFKQKLQNYDETRKLFVRSNIQSRYHGEAFDVLKKWTKSVLKKDLNIDMYKDELINMFDKKHILKNPLEIIKESIKIKNEKSLTELENEILKEHKANVNLAIEAGISNGLDFLLKEATAKGFVNKIKDELKTYRLPEGFKKAGVKLDSDEGFGELLEELEYNTQDKSKSFWNFLEQAGLKENALELELRNIKPEKYQENMGKIVKTFSELKKSVNITNAEVSKILPRLLTQSVEPSNISEELLSNTEKTLKENNVNGEAAINLLKLFTERFNNKAGKIVKPNLETTFKKLWADIVYKSEIKFSNAYRQKSIDIYNEVDTKIDYLNYFETPYNNELTNQKQILINKLKRVSKDNEKILKRFLKLLSK